MVLASASRPAAAAATATGGAKGGTLPFHRLSASITSWFRLPEQGMPHYEMLCRGTAFCVRRPSANDGSQLAFFTCSHVAAPWRWPRLYLLPWLEHVREEHTRCVLHVTEGRSGKVLARLLLRPRVLHHPDSLDVCLLHLEDEPGALVRMKEHGLVLSPLELSDAVPGAGQSIVTPGYVVDKAGEEDSGPAAFGLDDDEEGEGDDGVAALGPHVDMGQGIVLDTTTDQAPRRLCVSMGSVSPYRDARSRGFAAMDRILGDGVCGAPIIDLSSQRGGKCVGMVEGIVPPTAAAAAGGGDGGGGDDKVKDGVREAIAGNAGFVYGAELLKLLNASK